VYFLKCGRHLLRLFIFWRKNKTRYCLPFILQNDVLMNF